MSSTAILFHYRYHDREGVVPVVNIQYPDAVSPSYLDKLNSYLVRILQDFVVEKTAIDENVFWVEYNKYFNPNLDEGFGRVYAPFADTNTVKLNKVPYQSARKLAIYLLKTQLWQDEIVENEKYTLTSYTVNDIPKDQADLPARTAPVETRYAIGDIIMNSMGQKKVYSGLNFDPYNEYSDGWSEPDPNTPNGVLIGIKNNSWRKVEDYENFLKNTTIQIYPLPETLGTRGMPKNAKWFTRCKAVPGVEGFGRTQKSAKENLALKAIFV